MTEERREERNYCTAEVPGGPRETLECGEPIRPDQEFCRAHADLETLTPKDDA